VIAVLIVLGVAALITSTVLPDRPPADTQQTQEILLSFGRPTAQADKDPPKRPSLFKKLMGRIAFEFHYAVLSVLCRNTAVACFWL
jgi:hypothetical protein